MYNQFVVQKNDIRMNFFKGMYKETIDKCKNFIKLLKKEYKDIRLELCFCNFYIGNSYKNLHNIKQAFKYIKKTIRYCVNDSNLNEAMISLAECYEKTNRNNKAILNYSRCGKFYKKIGMVNSRRKILFRIAKLNNNPNTMKRIIKIVESKDDEELNSITEKYTDLVFFYLEHAKIEEARNLLHDIKNQDVREEVTTKTLGYLLKQIA